jgi:lincosamide nucleotidyltransferase A/C/D/E
MNADQAAEISNLILQRGIKAWLVGGWGIDALLGRQTREHKDLDLLIKVDDVARLLELLEVSGFTLKYTWEENRWIVEDGRRIPTAFVLAHEDGRELDFHAVRFDDRGVAVAAWEGERVFSPEDLAGVGTVSGVPVRCYSAEMQMRTHVGYALPPDQADDLKRLHETFGIDYPEELATLHARGTREPSNGGP